MSLQTLIYLDHAATTPVRAEVLDAMYPFFGPRFGNPSSTHRWGREARTALDEARERVARCIGSHTDEICFTSGGTEADNLAVLGGWRAARRGGTRNTIVLTPFEHKAVLEAAHAARREGADERFLKVPDGIVDSQSFDESLSDSVALVSVMWVNNEIGTVQDIANLARKAKERGALFHTDAVQAFGKVDISAAATPFDFLTLSGHKIGAPKGVGVLFIRRRSPLERLFHGGTQDRGRRPGTENVAFAVGLARAAELAVEERDAECRRLAQLRDQLENLLLARIPDAAVHGRGKPRAPHIVNVSVPGTDNESLLMGLDLAGVAASAGSACQAGSADASHVLSAIGAPPHLADSAIRFSLGALSTEEGVTRAAELFCALVDKARQPARAAS
jgi:cysteine desulfurase